MRHPITTALLLGALVALPVAAMAATPDLGQARPGAAQPAQKPAPAPTAKPAPAPAPVPVAAPAMHTAAGIVKSFTETSLVVTRPGKEGDITFTLNSATERHGALKNGATVSVRYKDEGRTHVATGVTVEEAKMPAPKTPPSL